MTVYSEFTLAAVQAAPVFLDRDASAEKACGLIDEAARKGATLVAFSETFLPGYPFFIGSSTTPLYWKAAAEYLSNAVEIPSATTDQLCAAARRASVDVVIGVVERDKNTQGTVYCTLLFISHEGVILGRHRKLKPTHSERRIWGDGDALGLKAYERPYGRISGLNCWEHNMVLPGYALMAQGTQIHVAVWPGDEPTEIPVAPAPLWARQILLSRAFASQGACYVVLASGILSPDHVPAPYRDLAKFSFNGRSCIIDPRGEIIAGPAKGETILMAKGNLESVNAAKVACDVGGHYSRPDLLQLHVNNQPIERIVRKKDEHSTSNVQHRISNDIKSDEKVKRSKSHKVEE